MFLSIYTDLKLLFVFLMSLDMGFKAKINIHLRKIKCYHCVIQITTQVLNQYKAYILT